MPAVAMPPAALMMAWKCFEGVRLMLRRLCCGDLCWPRLWSAIRSGIWTWFCSLVYGLVIRPRPPVPRPVLAVHVVDGWGWWGGVVGCVFIRRVGR